MTEPSTMIVDHIVHLTSPGALQETTKAWRDLGFIVIPGGTHADGLTENALVAFEDGAYIELISFTHPLSYYPADTPIYDARKNHSWARKQPGFIDFAFLGNAGYPSIAGAINARAEKEKSGVKYAGEVPGGRTRTDGKVLQWLITAPIQDQDGADVRGRLPFFCGDLTSRDLRVPHDPSETKHENTSLGIAHVHLLASSVDISRLAKQLTTVVGSDPTTHSISPSSFSLPPVARDSRPVDDVNNKAIRWELDSVLSSDSKTAPTLELSVPRNKEEETWLDERGPGIHLVKVRVKDKSQVSAETGDSSAAREVELVCRL
ncbi:hypothetical protein EUX98_g2329 [Antrodiella citrinella]|uniref:Glyoxalase-like domain-containing protein n=1 Tax=Antrodiella citrinella TaxID=2447956 RepID=A0A4S4N257_9APHY|nr:hypothetical protein EUX98_g2329 [Antrodiella citrinella]